MTQKNLTLTGEILGGLIRRHSGAVLLFHHALAERLGLGPTDLKCLDLLRERGALTGSDLAALTGLTTGAITGVVARLENAGFLLRKANPNDARKQILQPNLQRFREFHSVFEPIRNDISALLASFNTPQLTAIAQFLSHTTDVLTRHTALFRSQVLNDQPSKPAPPRRPKPLKRRPRKRTK